MAYTFNVRDSQTSQLWDFGWFDVTRFEVERALGVPADCASILRGFLRNSISHRSFCTSPDPWGNAGGLHGPFPAQKLDAGWYRPVSLEDLRHRVATALDDAEFTTPPSHEQRQPVAAWLDGAQLRGDDVVVLEAPPLPGVRVEWDVWLVFHEFVCFSPDRKEMTVAVIGYD